MGRAISISRSSRRWTFRVTALAVVVAVAVVLLVFFRNTGTPLKSTFTNQPPDIVKTEPTVPLSRQERQVAGRFILTAVQRKHLGEAWQLSGPHVRQDLTYKQWLTGNIPVVPYLGKIGSAALSVKLSTKDHALLDVAVAPPKGSSATAQLFSLELRRFGTGKDAHWLVDNWVPSGSTPVPGAITK